MRWEKNGDCCWCVVELIIYFGHNSHIPIHWSHMSSDQNPPFDKETKMRSFSRRHHDRFKIEGEGIPEKNILSFFRLCTHYPFPPSRNLCIFSTWKKCQHRFGHPPSPQSYLRYAAKQKKRYYLGIFPNMGGGVFPNPKTFVNLPSIFLYAKFILRC